MTPRSHGTVGRGLRGVRRSGSLAQVAFAALLVVVGAYVVGGLSPQYHEFVLATLINIVIVVGLYVFIGNSGVISFGQTSFMAIGAYATGLLTVAPMQKGFLLPDLPHWVATLQVSEIPAMGMVALGVGLCAVVLGVPLMRLTGIAASIATLSLLLVVNVVLVQTTTWTGGNQAFIGVPLTDTTTVFVVCAVLAIAVAFLFERSSVGLRLQATREDEPAARAAGIRVLPERLVAFFLSGALVGLAGALYAHLVGSFDPSSFYLGLAFITLAMLVVGGLFSLSGAIVGAVVLSSVQEVLSRLENGEGVGPIQLTLRDGTTDVVLACIVIAVMLFRPAGIMGGRPSTAAIEGPHEEAAVAPQQPHLTSDPGEGL